MAVRRTKKQKLQADLKRAEATFEWSSADSNIGTSSSSERLLRLGKNPEMRKVFNNKDQNGASLLRFAPSFIYQDLLKTLVSTLIIGIILAAIAWRLSSV